MSDNPSAFPHDLLRDDDAYPTHDASPGMTLRDYFAGQALAGMLAHGTRYKPREGADRNWHVAIADEAYELADAMLAARTGDA